MLTKGFLSLVVLTVFLSAQALKLMMNSRFLGKSPIFVAGGSSGVGYELVRRLSQRGTPVKVLVRRPDALEYLKLLPGVTPQLGDALDADAVQKCMEGCVAAVTTLGGQPIAGQVERVDYAGNSNVIEQAGILGVERIVLVTSVGCGPTITAIPNYVYRTLQGALEAKSKAERDLKMYTNLDWTIIRPGGLTNDPPSGKAILTEDILASGSVSREDVAEVILKVLGSTGQCTRREFTVVDPKYSPEYSYVPFAF
eukprot:gene28823-34791_t